MIHCGTSGEEWKKLHERLRRILWMSDREITEETGFEDYGAVFVDEAHLLSEEPLKRIIRAAGTRPVIFSSDCEDQLSPEEADRSAKNELEKPSGDPAFPTDKQDPDKCGAFLVYPESDAPSGPEDHPAFPECHSAVCKLMSGKRKI